LNCMDEQNDLKYKKPKIMLIDLEDHVFNSIKSAGFNVFRGTFGSPYGVRISDSIEPVAIDFSLPNIGEQDVLIVDLKEPELIEKPTVEISAGTEHWYAKCNTGKIDPRPIAMQLVKKYFDRIYENEGIIIVFVSSILINDIRFCNYYNKNDARIIRFHSCSFLSILNYLDIDIEFGNEIRMTNDVPFLCSFLEKYLPYSSFETTLEPVGFLEEKWIPILQNKTKASVGGLILNEGKSLVFILPQIAKKDEVILELLKEILPELFPHLFPEIEGGKWINRDEYEFESILVLKAEIKSIHEEANKGILDVEARINLEREKLGFLHGILTKTGNDLVIDVIKCLELFGFKNIISVDDQIKEGENLQEDLQIHDDSPILLVEIKGLTGVPDEKDTTKILKYMLRRSQEWKKDVGGVFIVNHERNIPPTERNNNRVFTEQQINDANLNNVALIATWDLFLLARGMIKWNWNPYLVKEIFYKKGVFNRIPSFYKPIGKISKYWDKAQVISMELNENSYLRKGNRIGYLRSNEYLEEVVSSMQIEGLDVEKAESGQRVGIKTIYPGIVLKEGMDVYSIN
jgi:hypothetical protein